VSYDNQLILPVDLIALGGFAGGPTYSTSVVRTPNGSEYRDVMRGYSLGRYVISYSAMLQATSTGGRRPVSYEDMFAFFHNAQGRRYSFRARDPLDCTTTTTTGKFIATATSTEWQMVKRYTVGSSTHDRIITKPFPTATAAAGTIAVATGLVTNATMPSHWSGSYYLNVRFDTDEMFPTWFNNSAGQPVLGWQDIPLVEVRDS
jgi:uncharacterized protein (TIGR02217 family)